VDRQPVHRPFVREPRDGHAADVAIAALSNVSSPSAVPTRVALAERALEDPERQPVDEVLLDDALERAGAVGRVVAQVAQQRPRLVGQRDLDPALAHPRQHEVDLEVDALRCACRSGLREAHSEQPGAREDQRLDDA
jgi:hypothetical protein